MGTLGEISLVFVANRAWTRVGFVLALFLSSSDNTVNHREAESGAGLEPFGQSFETYGQKSI